VFWVISVYFNIRNTLPKFGTFLLGHPVYIYNIYIYIQGVPGGMCIYIYIYWCLQRGLGGGGGTFWPLNESPTFKSSDAKQSTAVNQTGVNKIPPNFDTLFAATLVAVRLFKGLTARSL